MRDSLNVKFSNDDNEEYRIKLLNAYNMDV